MTLQRTLRVATENGRGPIISVNEKAGIISGNFTIKLTMIGDEPGTLFKVGPATGCIASGRCRCSISPEGKARPPRSKVFPGYSWTGPYEEARHILQDNRGSPLCLDMDNPGTEIINYLEVSRTSK